jgi:hypothetical protein
MYFFHIHTVDGMEQEDTIGAPFHIEPTPPGPTVLFSAPLIFQGP